MGQNLAINYYPFGLTFNSYQRVTAKENKYNTFQDQEKITALDLNWIQFEWRNHDPAIGRFFNIDPIAEDYYYNSTYAFSENKVVAHVEIEGLESKYINPEQPEYVVPASDVIRHTPPADAIYLNNGPTQWVEKELTPGDKMLNGTGNMLFGAVGAVLSSAYIIGTDGAGAALGGTIALTASLGKFTIGGAQFIDGLSDYFGGPTGQSGVLQQSNTIPGLVAFGAEMEEADLIDAGAQMIPAVMSGNIGVFDSFKQFRQSNSLLDVLNSTDAVLDIRNLLYEGVETYSEQTSDDEN